MDKNDLSDTFRRFYLTVKELRSPGGCPWDLAQTHESLKPYAVEETYELLDAISSEKDPLIKEELGDVLLQVVLHSVIAEQRNAFNLNEVVAGINAKMIQRHPHVFKKNEAEHSHVNSPSGAINHFLKQKEKEKKFGEQNTLGLPSALPALQKAQKIGDKSHRFKFDWSSASEVLNKLKEELAELSEEVLRKEKDPERLSDELGDLLFTAAQLGRHLGLQSEEVLQKANRKFESRLFKMLELGKINLEQFSGLSSDKKEELWSSAKKALS